jgi:hypothetical protein
LFFIIVTQYFFVWSYHGNLNDILFIFIFCQYGVWTIILIIYYFLCHFLLLRQTVLKYASLDIYLWVLLAVSFKCNKLLEMEMLG